jgi:hypothetical protein
MSSAALHLVIDTVDATDVSSADAAQLELMLGQLRSVQGWKDAAEARLTSQLRILHDTAGGAPPADVHTKGGGVSAAEGKRRERRSKTIDEAPSFGDALASGAIGAEHVDALANATTKLDDEVKEALFDCEDDLLSDATRMSPEQFGRSCRDLARRLEKDHGLQRNRRQRRDTFLSRKLNPGTGMIEGRFALHPELGNQIFAWAHAINWSADQSVRSLSRSNPTKRPSDTPAASIRWRRAELQPVTTLVGVGETRASSPTSSAISSLRYE